MHNYRMPLLVNIYSQHIYIFIYLLYVNNIFIRKYISNISMTYQILPEIHIYILSCMIIVDN